MNVESRRITRVPDINTARERILRRREEKQIRLIQAALERYPHGSRFVGRNGLETGPSDEKDIVAVRSEIFNILSKFAGEEIYPDNPIDRERIALEINSRVGHLLNEDWGLNSLAIPAARVMSDLRNDPHFDPESIHILSSNTRMRRSYNELVYRGYPALNIRDLPSTRRRDMAIVFCRAAFTPRRSAR